MRRLWIQSPSTTKEKDGGVREEGSGEGRREKVHRNQPGSQGGVFQAWQWDTEFASVSEFASSAPWRSCAEGVVLHVEGDGPGEFLPLLHNKSDTKISAHLLSCNSR